MNTTADTITARITAQNTIIAHVRATLVNTITTADADTLVSSTVASLADDLARAEGALTALHTIHGIITHADTDAAAIAELARTLKGATRMRDAVSTVAASRRAEAETYANVLAEMV